MSAEKVAEFLASLRAIFEHSEILEDDRDVNVVMAEMLKEG